MRVLIGPEQEGELTDERLAELYAVPSKPWLRTNMISTLDGSAQGPDGLTGTINNAADNRVFHLLRKLADVVMVGAGTARAEGYGPADRPMVVLTRSALVPSALRSAEPGRVLIATCESAPGLAGLRDELGEEQVIIAGRDTVDLAFVKQELGERGFGNILCEGGPHLLADQLAAGVLDELCETFVPRAVGGPGFRIVEGEQLDVSFSLELLLESEGTLIGRWFAKR